VDFGDRTGSLENVMAGYGRLAFFQIFSCRLVEGYSEVRQGD